MSRLVSVLKEKLAEKPRFKVVAMPDFYLDYLLAFPGKLEEVTGAMVSVAGRGGGNLLGWKHLVGRGGNASNFSAQLSNLDVNVVPIIETDEFGKMALTQFLKATDLSHVTNTGSLSKTLAFEAEYSGRRVNIMASDPGSLSSFGPGRLTAKDRELIREADFVCVFNWNQNLKGTELAEEVFQIAKTEGRGVTFFDPGDPTSRASEIPRLNDQVLSKGLVDVLSLNENELTQLASAVGEAGGGFEGEEDNPLFQAASVFSMLGSRVDLHTSSFSATFIDGQRERVLCASTTPLKVTGAGDAWNAGDIFAQGIALSHKDRLTFANATAAAYMRRADLEPCSLTEILDQVGEIEKLNTR
ncbi:carbohydrate kinase family protein [Candidatus Bathyarchaeota archaeon]|nr:MAG: carbohydrate kinase family protein [Candidatus Bathyarchaeota archaeon]